ncbi:uncharacterized protein BP5553_02013 [Venustampulla echinocandica]|uniref:Zn(2)-C6 fungal-type domain-containing protein n=1 Tax=Venustampulla echinocandica TaxID=2656787 RepID=A0A370U2M6_9HELO|nr:uncharacterized protein BP5553_02013 [Venustampulla echinocandica]RDL42034.1 hypothetical protein BP5553_02013 [Venustampulla echinocandica]
MGSHGKSDSDFLHPNRDFPTELYRHPSLERKGRPDKRGRASKPKVKSGCITCKTRRVKCDETKPECLRCQRFGRPCDGYAPDASRSRSVSHIRPRSSSTSLYSPTISIHGADEESRYFQVFAERTVYEIPGFFDGTPSSTFWSQLVLQESHHVSAIRHAAISLGALSKGLEDAPPPHLKSNVFQNISGKHHEYAVLQHIKAIKALNQYISSSPSPQLRSALITCVLFICFEASQESKASCIQQTQAGLKMLRSYYTRKPQSRSTTPTQAVQSQWDVSMLSGQSRQHRQTQMADDNMGERAVATHIDDYREAELTVQLDVGFESRRTSSEIRSSSLTLGLMGEYMNPQSPTIGIDTNSEGQNMGPVYSPRNYLNALPSNASDLSWEAVSEYSPSSFAVGDLAPKFSISAASSPLTEAPPSRPLSVPLPTTPLPSPTQRRSLLLRAPTPPLLQSDIAIEDIVVQTFIRANGQGFFYNTMSCTPPLAWDLNNVHRIPIPNIFPNFHAAHLCWDFLMDRALQFVTLTRYNRLYVPSANEPPEIISHQLLSLQNELSAFETAFRPILDKAILPDGTVANPAALTISLYQKCTAIAITVMPDDSEMLYDYCLPHFIYIVRTCRILAGLHDTARLPRMPRFSFDVGIVPPLHFTATKCRDPIIRREAVDLLFSYPRHEGIWDGILSARLGRWIIACEEEGLDLSGLPVRVSKMPGLWERQHPEEEYHYPIPQPISGTSDPECPRDCGQAISETIDKMTAVGIKEYELIRDGGGLVNNSGIPPHSGFESSVHNRKGKERMSQDNLSFAPEESRVRVGGVDYHIADRYIKVCCQRVMPRADDTIKARETVLAW